jgi:Flp pilus assembly pilin Flp
MSEGRWSLLHGEEGASAVEYGILAAGVGIVLVAAGPALAAAFLELISFITGGFSR